MEPIIKLKEELYSEVKKEDLDRIENFMIKHSLEKMNLNNKEWNFIDTGSGKQTIVIFPGGLMRVYLSSTSYIDALERDYRIIGFSHPMNCTIKEFIEGVNEIIKRKKIDKFYLMGHSFGGLLAQCYSDFYPKKIKGLILINTLSGATKFLTKIVKLSIKITSLLKQKTVLNLYKKQLITLLSVPKLNKEFWSSFLNDVFFNYYTFEDYNCFQQNQLEYMKDYSEMINSYKGKVLIINSKDDKSTIKGLKNKLYQRYPNAKIYNFEVGGHIPAWTIPEEFRKVIKSFLDNSSNKK